MKNSNVEGKITRYLCKLNSIENLTDNLSNKQKNSGRTAKDMVCKYDRLLLKAPLLRLYKV